MILSAALAGLALTATAPGDPKTLQQFIALEQPAPSRQLSYGWAASQTIDLFLPPGPGPHPTAILIHGGCWSQTTAGRSQLRSLAADLARRGVAVWSIGYRRANEDGGGYPGTFEDVGRAIDLIGDYAPLYRLDLERTVLVGHSAGGHLALWAASREKRAPQDRFYPARPLHPRRVISLAGVGDLEAFSPRIADICGADVLAGLTRPAIPGGRAAFADISPSELPAPAAPVTMVSGVLDRLVPPYVADDYAHAMRGRATAVETVDIPGAGHWDLVMPGTAAWRTIRQRIEDALSAKRRPGSAP